MWWINHRRVLGVPLHILSDERAQRNHAEIVLLRQSEHCADQGRPDTLSLKRLGGFGVYQAKEIARPLVDQNGIASVNVEFEAVERGVVADFRREHDFWIVLCCSWELT